MGMRLCVAGLECVLGMRLCVQGLECILLLSNRPGMQLKEVYIHSQVLI